MTSEIKAYKPPEDWQPPKLEVVQDDDFLDFWNSRKRETKRILGVEIVVPNDLPLKFKQLYDDLADSQDESAMRTLLTVLFGKDPIDAWIEAGVTRHQLAVLMMWGMANGSGAPTSFEQAADMVVEAEKAAAEKGKAGNAPNRAARRASSKTRASGGTGDSSSRTSGASTSSPRKKSRT